MIQIKLFEEEKKDNLSELDKILIFCTKENIDVDVEPPKKFKGWVTEGNVSYLKE